jgi:ribosomal protein S18 acetylase RimI-like enzyme
MIEIRRATLADVPEMARVHVQADWDTYAPLFGAQAYRLDTAESVRRWRQALENGGTLLVPTDGGAIVGLGHAHADRIDALYLLSAYHRRGIGKAMLAQLLRALHERGVAEARLDVVAVNAQAIAFYAAQGARTVGRCINADPRGDTEDLIMAIATGRGGPLSRSARC